MICMIYRVTLVPGMRNDYLNEFRRISTEVRTQKGCVEYDIFVDSTDLRFDNVRRDDLAMILEKWECIEDLQEHSRSEVMNSFRARTKDLRVGSDYELLTAP